MNYRGVIIEESLTETPILKELEILETNIEQVTPRYQTPWLTQWTLHTVEVLEDKASQVAGKLSKVLDTSHGHWYADFKNDEYHYIIFKDKVFKVKRDDEHGYREAKSYGVSLGIPEYQVDFSPQVEVKD